MPPTAKPKTEQRGATRQSLSLPFRLVPSGRPNDVIDGETIDVSSRGVGVKFGRGKLPRVDALLEDLVEDRLRLEITLRFPEGSVAAAGQLMWWGVLGDDEKFALRGGILLLDDWSDADWEIIEKHLAASA